jgi:Flp pilus assembly protein CpaB
MNRSHSFLRNLRKAVRWHRRLLAGGSAAAAVYFALAAVSPEPPPTVAVLAAARDLPGGAVPSSGDLRTLNLPRDVVPTGVLHPGTDLARRILATPVRSGEPLTDARFLSPGTLGSDLVAYPLRLDDADIAALLRVGDQIAIYGATSTATPAAGLLAEDVRVITLPNPRASPTNTPGALIVVAVSPETAARLAQATTNTRLTIALTAPPKAP